MKYEEIPVSITTRVVISDLNTGEVLADKSNRIHPQNMSRIIARGLANEANSTFYRMGFGNGGSYTDAAGNLVFNPPNDGSEGGWESRLYNETYSEVIQQASPLFETDPGSADDNVVRAGGGASPADDPAGGGVVSVEVGVKSNVIITMTLNQNEPTGQMMVQDLGQTMNTGERDFLFDEIGIFSPGLPARSTTGYSTINVSNKISSDNTTLVANTTYNMAITVDNTIYTCFIRTPASGTGLSGQLTYGDLCEGINTGIWILSGDQINTVMYVYITDRSGGTYPSITNKQSYGSLIFQSLTVGNSSSVGLNCASGDSSNFYNVLTSGVCSNTNFIVSDGVSAGVANNAVTPALERERLLTHFIFSPILKSADRSIQIVYSLTISCTPGTSASYTLSS